MKKTLALLLALVMVLGMAACGAAAPATTTTAPAAPAVEAEPVVEEEIPDAAEFLSDAFINPLDDWAQYDEMIAAIKAETDYSKRTQMMRDAEDILMSNFAIIPIYYYNDVYLQKDYVSGIYSNPFGTKFFMYTTMANGADTLKLNLSSEPDYLDPALNSSVDGACLAANSFSGLYSYNAEGVTEPACATGYTVSDDGLTYTVTLQEGLKWSDGSDLTAADFEYSWKRATAPATAADYEYMFSGFDGYGTDAGINVTAIDDTTLEFVLAAPCAYIEDLMAFPTFFPVKQSEVEKYDDWETNPGHWCQDAGFISNGAYVCTGWNHQVSMTYEKNPYWYNADKVTVEKLEYMLSADDTAIYAAYNDGSIDFADSVPTDEIQSLLDNPEFNRVDELGTYYICFNVKSPMFEGKTPEQAAAMRKALCILIDRDYICETIGQTGQKAANAFLPLGMADGNGGFIKENTDVQGYFDPYAINDNYDETVELARNMLKSAGFKFDEDGTLSAETPLTLNYLTNPTSGHVAIAEAVQQDLGVLGIEMGIEQQDWNVFLEERKAGNYDVARNGWIADFNDPINMLEMWTTTSGNNDIQYGRVG
jgi:peptide/nickel transport system substrate-binding protein/oligopeptide transport system substrate-binding protein